MKKAEINRHLAALSSKDRKRWEQEPPTRERLEAAIEQSKQHMQNDLWVGIPWAVMYLLSLYFYGLNSGTVAIFVVGLVYFIQAYVRNGSYGDNRKRVQVYERILKNW